MGQRGEREREREKKEEKEKFVYPHEWQHYSQLAKGRATAHPLTDECVHKMCPRCTKGYYSAFKGGNPDTCYNKDKPWGHYAKLNKPVTHKKYCKIPLK